MSIAPVSASPAAEQQKIASSCREFEGVLWRQILEQSLKPLMSGTDTASDRTGTYGYLISNALADAVSGGPNSFSALLETQLTAPSPPSARK